MPLHPKTVKLSQDVILSAYNHIETWEDWAETVPRPTVKALNTSLIRLTKGMLKAWRTFLIEEQQTTASSLPVQPPLPSKGDNHGTSRRFL